MLSTTPPLLGAATYLLALILLLVVFCLGVAAEHRRGAARGARPARYTELGR